MKYILLSIAILAGCSTGRKNPDSLQFISSPAQSPSGEPWLYTNASGTTYLSWIETLDGKNFLKFSKLENNTWSPPKIIHSGENWFVNWADYPAMVSNGEVLMAHYLQKSGTGKFAYDVMITRSMDSGATWTDPVPVHDDGKQAEHGFVTILPVENNFMVTWLDGRNTVMEGMESHEGHHGQMSIRAAMMNYDGIKVDEWELDNRTCDCCQTTAAMTDNGPVIIYRDRSDDEIRDMSIVRFINGKWTAPETVFADEWKIAGCPVNGPRSAAIDNNLAIAWYALVNNESKVQVVFSPDGGATFEKPIRVDEGKPIGRVDLVMPDKDRVIVSWMEGAEIKVAEVNRSGDKHSLFTVAASSEARSSGFPQMTLSGKQLVLAWTDDKEKMIKTAVAEIH
jgi:hypothetical protein